MKNANVTEKKHTGSNANTKSGYSVRSMTMTGMLSAVDRKSVV